MRRIKKSSVRILLSLYMLFVIITAATFPIMPFSSQATARAPVIAVGLTFWIGTVFSLIFLVLTFVKYKKWNLQEHGDEIPRKTLPGVIKFFSSTPAAVADGVFIASLISFIVLQFTKYSGTYAGFILLFLIIVSFNLHSILNGKIYKEIKKKTKRGEKRP